MLSLSTRHRLREQLERVQPFSLIALACTVGVIPGCGAIVFAELINLVQWLSEWELIIYLFLGIACGLGGVAFIFVLDLLERGVQAVKINNLWKPALGGLILGVAIIFVPDIYGVGYATMDEILRGGVSWSWLLLPIKMVDTSLTLASGGSGGVFLPSLYLGSITGGLIGIGAGTLLPSITAPSGGYALVGMAAFLAAATHSPITAFLLLFELTGDYHIILPLMLSCSVSTLVAKMLLEESIYTLSLVRRGIDVRRREENIMRAFTVGQIMQAEAPVLTESAPFAEVVQHFLTTTVSTCFVIDEHKRLCGEISLHDVKGLLQEEGLGALIIARDLLNTSRVTVRPEDTLAHCLERFSQTEQEFLPVTTADEQLCGVLSHRAVMALYNREILRQEYLGLNLRTDGVEPSVHEHVRLPHQYVVQVVQIPSWYTGKTLRVLQLGTQFHLTAVALRRGSTTQGDELPDPDYPLSPQDALVLVGRPVDLACFLTEQEEPEPYSSSGTIL